MKRSGPQAATLAVLGLCGIGGCTRFQYDKPEPPPVQLREPTTMPSNEGVQTGTFSGDLYRIFVELPVRLYEQAQGNTPYTQALALEDSQVPDRRRIGIAELAGYPFGKSAPYTTRYRQMAQTDPDPMVRATAIRALNRSRDQFSTGVFIESLADENADVRLEACKALANVPNPNAVPPLLKVFTKADEDEDVRIAAADALRQYRNLEAARALVTALTDHDFGVAWQSRQSLRTMTGYDRQYDQSAWLTLITGPENPLGS